MKKLNYSGFSAIEALLVIVILGIVGFTGYFVWHAKKTTDTTLKNTDTSTSNKISPKKTTTPVSTTPVLAIKEWNVVLPLTSAISDAYYVYDSQASDADYQHIYIGTHSLDALDPECKADGPAFALLSRETAAVHDKNAQLEQSIDTPVYTNRVGNYYYDYQHAQSACSNNDAAVQKQDADATAFAAAVKNIQAQ